jgi:hypothetical protein
MDVPWNQMVEGDLKDSGVDKHRWKAKRTVLSGALKGEKRVSD